MLSFFNDQPATEQAANQLLGLDLYERLKRIFETSTSRGVAALNIADPLVRIGVESDSNGHPVKSGYGLFDLAWQSARNPEWQTAIASEISTIKAGVKQAHHTTVRFILWAGMGGSAEDKAMYGGAGLLRKGPRLYVLDSTDPAKLKHILLDMQARSKKTLPEVLCSTVVFGMAMGMTSYEPVVNLRKIAELYRALGIESTANIYYLTLPGSLLDQFGKECGYRAIPLQMDERNSTAGRHSAPLSRGSLLPLGFASVPLGEWMAATQLSHAEVDDALRLAAFIHGHSKAGRDKLCLLLPKTWISAAIWTKQNLEESLGKSEDFLLKVVVNERLKLVQFRPPKDPAQDRCFLAVQIKGEPHPDANKISSLRRAGYPVAVLSFARAELSRFMQTIHYVVFGVACLEDMNFVTQPGVELYKTITGHIDEQSRASGGIENTAEWRSIMQGNAVVCAGSLHVHLYNYPAEAALATGGNAPEVLARILHRLAQSRNISYGELTYFGDTRYNPAGRSVRKLLDRGADALFRSALKMPADVYEGPAMNHSYHEMVIGSGRAFSIIFLARQSEQIDALEYSPDYHRAQFIATQLALKDRGRHVMAITVPDLGADSLKALEQFLLRTAKVLKSL